MDILTHILPGVAAAAAAAAAVVAAVLVVVALASSHSRTLFHSGGILASRIYGEVCLNFNRRIHQNVYPASRKQRLGPDRQPDGLTC